MHTFEEVLCRLDKHIWYMAHRFGQSIKAHDIDDLHQEGVIKLYEIYSSAAYTGKTPDELDAIFKRALSNMLRDIYSDNKRKVQLWSSDELDFESEVYGHDAFLDLYLAYHKNHFSQRLTPDAVVLLDALLDPSPAAYHLYHIHVMRLKAIRSQGHNVRIPTQLTHEIVGKSLGFTLAKTKFLMKRIQKAWRAEQQLTGKYRQSAVAS